MTDYVIPSNLIHSNGSLIHVPVMSQQDNTGIFDCDMKLTERTALRRSGSNAGAIVRNISELYIQCYTFLCMYIGIGQQGNGNINYQIGKQQFSNSNHLCR